MVSVYKILWKLFFVNVQVNTVDFNKSEMCIRDRAFADDSSYYLLCALEVIDEDGRLERKADMFTKRTIKPQKAVDLSLIHI